VVATCDKEIGDFCHYNGIGCVMTSDKHTRAMDRVAEAALLMKLEPTDLVVNVQGDEPMVTAGLIKLVVDPLVEKGKSATILGIPIIDYDLFVNPDILKIVMDTDHHVLYTSRSPIPYLEPNGTEFNAKHGAVRIGGVFGFQKFMLDWFQRTDQSRLEIKEACDSNRFCGHGQTQYCAVATYRPYFSVDRIEDVALVEAAWKSE
jgi:3-deoxy-manno-octulosonate cytidylyltransferase (CMP-KDO synthetase)